jgi:hypothetical protein
MVLMQSTFHPANGTHSVSIYTGNGLSHISIHQAIGHTRLAELKTV